VYNFKYNYIVCVQNKLIEMYPTQQKRKGHFNSCVVTGVAG